MSRNSLPSGLQLLTGSFVVLNSRELMNWLVFQPGQPVQMTIPAINVNAAVQEVGVTPNGTMDVPSNAVDVGWYKLGRSPGEIGNAVMAGHFDGKKGEPGVFNDLDKLQPGNKIYVKDERGMTTTFVVRESREYNPDADAADVFGSSDGKAHLNLITCEGTWNKLKNSYSHRLVVFTDREDEYDYF
jgi:LPXTG-site transpeptidase (sortase) family protein